MYQPRPWILLIILVKGELDTGKLSVVSSAPTCIHALGAVTKIDDGYRPVTDASKPDGLSIYSYMFDTFEHFSYTSIDDVTKVLQPGMFMAVSDISSASRSIMIRPGDRQYQGLCWKVRWE